MTRKLFALLLACLLILISFTACGTKTPEPGTTAAENTTAAEVNAQTSAEETAASSEAVSESAEESTAQSAQKTSRHRSPQQLQNRIIPVQLQKASLKSAQEASKASPAQKCSGRGSSIQTE